ncbi:MAG: LPS assembly lipoprotein LptE [Deltaproteobacteria bacterium]
MPRSLKKSYAPVLAVLCFLGLSLILAGCGYHLLGQVSSERPSMKLAIDIWQNQTSELAIETELLQEISRWASKASFISLTDDQDAEYILKGKIISLRSPGRTYNATDQVVELQAELTVSYTLIDRQGKIIFQEPSLAMTEDYPLGTDAIRTRDNLRHALNLLFRDLAEEIYMRILIAYDQQGTD